MGENNNNNNNNNDIVGNDDNDNDQQQQQQQQEQEQQEQEQQEQVQQKNDSNSLTQAKYGFRERQDINYKEWSNEWMNSRFVFFFVIAFFFQLHMHWWQNYS